MKLRRGQFPGGTVGGVPRFNATNVKHVCRTNEISEHLRALRQIAQDVDYRSNERVQELLDQVRDAFRGCVWTDENA